MTRARTIAVLAVGVTLLATLAGCGEWNPWNAAPPTVAPTETVGPTDAVPTDAVPTDAPATETAPTTAPAKTPTATAAPPTAATLGPLSGTWVGEWVNETPVAGHGTFTLRWGQQGNQLFGTVTIAGSNCLSSGSITGTVTGIHVRFGAVEHVDDEDSVSVDYSGTVSGPNTLVGTYESNCGPSRGTWTANRLPQG